MISKKHVKELFEGLKEELGTAEEVKAIKMSRNKSKIAIDSLEKAFRMYIKYLRNNTK